MQGLRQARRAQVLKRALSLEQLFGGVYGYMNLDKPYKSRVTHRAASSNALLLKRILSVTQTWLASQVGDAI